MNSFETVDCKLRNANFGKKGHSVIYRHGDYIDDIYLDIKLPVLSENKSYVNNLGYKIIKWVTLEIGGVKIDSYPGSLMMIKEQLTNGQLPTNKHTFTQSVVENAVLGDWSHKGTSVDEDGKPCINLIVPLRFFQIPLYALKHHDVRIYVEFENVQNCVYNITDSVDDLDDIHFHSAELNINYSSKNFSSGTNDSSYPSYPSLNLDIIQHQFTGIEGIQHYREEIDLHFKNLVHYLIICSTCEIERLSYSVSGKLFNNEKSGLYYNEVVPKQLFNGYLPEHTYIIPFITSYDKTTGINLSTESMTLKCVFSKEKKQDDTIKTYAISKNELRVMSGMAGLRTS